MSPLLYGLCRRLFQILAAVPFGTNLGLLQLFFALLSGRFLPSRGALFPALAETGLSEEAVRRSGAALREGKWNLTDLLNFWRECVQTEGHFRRHAYEGYHPVTCDLVGFFRARLTGQVGKHYTSQAGKALPALVFGMVADVGSVGPQRLPLLRKLTRQKADETEGQLQARLLKEMAATLTENEMLVTDAGFSLADLLQNAPAAFVTRLDQNVTARRNRLPEYQGRGAPPKFGEIVRPLARTYAGKQLAATAPDATARWKAGKHRVKAWIFEDLVLSTARPGSASFRIVVIFDPRYPRPLIVATNRKLTAYALWCVYRDRWPVEQMPLAAKQMLGCERAFVFGDESRWRLPDLTMLAGNLLSYVAACSQPVATGFWDRCARPTSGRLQRMLGRLRFSDFPSWRENFEKRTVRPRICPKE